MLAAFGFLSEAYSQDTVCLFVETISSNTLHCTFNFCPVCTVCLSYVAEASSLIQGIAHPTSSQCTYLSLSREWSLLLRGFLIVFEDVITISFVCWFNLCPYNFINKITKSFKNSAFAVPCAPYHQHIEMHIGCLGLMPWLHQPKTN